MGSVVVDVTGRRVGVVRRVLCAAGDPYTAKWAVVTLGPWRARPRAVPLTDVRHDDSRIRLAYRRTVVVASPKIGREVDDVTLHQARVFYDNHQHCSSRRSTAPAMLASLVCALGAASAHTPWTRHGTYTAGRGAAAHPATGNLRNRRLPWSH